ncbi:MAG TPA: helix-turn-helix domain-containing protein [Verrucomicrobiae bacterium]|nr:helix-turn-helix domain-containing protein [Verrucomicrobiae bacterium]
MPASIFQPTLWRTCRVLANESRLRLFAQLVRNQPQSVSELSRQCSLPLPVASQSLRALEARGLLRVNRVRRRVEYHIPTRSEAGALASLVAALQAALRVEPLPIELILKLATAFTHPARIQIHRLLLAGPKTELQIRAAVRLSLVALWRHLRKLTKRGFVRYDDARRIYVSCNHPDRIGRALSALTEAGG